jgi:hypothetical protein
VNELLSPSTGEAKRSSTYHPGIPVPPIDYQESPDDIPIYPDELVRKRHWLEPVSTNFLPESSNLTEEEHYFNSWDKYP